MPFSELASRFKLGYKMATEAGCTRKTYATDYHSCETKWTAVHRCDDPQ